MFKRCIFWSLLWSDLHVWTPAPTTNMHLQSQTSPATKHQPSRCQCRGSKSPHWHQACTPRPQTPQANVHMATRTASRHRDVRIPMPNMKQSQHHRIKKLQVCETHDSQLTIDRTTMLAMHVALARTSQSMRVWWKRCASRAQLSWILFPHPLRKTAKQMCVTTLSATRCTRS